MHSLGGLVTKKALCLSQQTIYPHLEHLNRCSIGVVFLGTPHRGSNFAPFAASVANILKAGGKRVNKEILQLLSRDSEVLADVEESYAVWLRRNNDRFDLTCFFEELELPAVGMVSSLLHSRRFACTLLINERLWQRNRRRLAVTHSYQSMQTIRCVDRSSFHRGSLTIHRA